MLIYTIGKLRYPDINQCVYSRFFYCIHFFWKFHQSVGRSVIVVVTVVVGLVIHHTQINRFISFSRNYAQQSNKSVHTTWKLCSLRPALDAKSRENIFPQFYCEACFSSLILVFLFFVSFRFSFLHLLWICINDNSYFLSK